MIVSNRSMEHANSSVRVGCCFVRIVRNDGEQRTLRIVHQRTKSLGILRVPPAVGEVAHHKIKALAAPDQGGYGFCISLEHD